MKEYTFNDTDKLKTTCEEMAADIANGFVMQDVEAKLEDLEEIIEIHERNSTNLAHSGGLASLITF